MAREYFNAYHSYLKSVEPLNDAECGRLFRACLTYSMSREEPELRGNERFVWPTIREQIDRDMKKYEDFCKKQSSNIKKRWDTTVYVGKSGIPNDTKHTKEKEKEKEKEINIVDSKESTKSTPEEFFETVWALYPNKKGKGKVGKAKKLELMKLGLETVKKCIERYQKSKPDWQQWQNGSTFFNSGYIDYLDGNFSQKPAGEVRDFSDYLT